jgi:hypothetical protein
MNRNKIIRLLIISREKFNKNHKKITKNILNKKNKTKKISPGTSSVQKTMDLAYAKLGNIYNKK